MLLGKLAVVSFFAAAISVAYAQDGDPVSTAIRSELSKRFPHTRIELVEEPHWTSAQPQSEITSVRVGAENARGQIQFTVNSRGDGGAQASYGWVTFAAYQPARVMVRRVLPGEKLQAGQFTVRDINVAVEPVRDFRGVILDHTADISHLEARQTLLEGQPLLSSAVQKIPDVRRGDAIRVQIVSNGLVLSTRATASEPAYVNGSVRVLTEKTKRELAGRLVSPGVVEVKL